MPFNIEFYSRSVTSYEDEHTQNGEREDVTLFELQEAESSQHALFSIYCGVLVPVSYHLSREASDPSVLW